MNQIRELLKEQKPLKKNRAPAISLRALLKSGFRRITRFFPAAFVIASAIFFGRQGSLPDAKHPSIIQIIPATKNFPREKISEINSQLSGSLTEAANTREYLQRLSEKVIDNSKFTQIHLLKTSPDTIYLFAQKPEPVFRIEADKTRFVSPDGLVYGDAYDSQLPFLRGIFPGSGKKFRIKAPNLLCTSHREKERIRAAIQLRHLLGDANLMIEEVIFENFRGYSAVLSDSETRVNFGVPPFSGKIKKLHSILKELAKEGRYASRVELDYDNKAFIKEKIY